MITTNFFNSTKSSFYDSYPSLYTQIYLKPNRWIERHITLKIPETILSVAYKACIIAENILIRLAITTSLILSMRRTKKYLCEEITAQAGDSVFKSFFDCIFNFNDPFNYLRDLNHAHLRGHLPSTYSNPTLENRLGTLLSNRFHVMLVGEAGSGKTTTVLSFVKFLESPECPPALQGKRIYQLDLDSLLANPQKFLEQFSSIFPVLSDPHAILFVDEAHRLNEQIHGHRLSDSLKLFLEVRSIVLIGATTQKECLQWYSQDPAMARRFFTIEMPPANKQEHINKLKAKFSSKFQDPLPTEVLEKAIELAKICFPTETLPASAVKVLHNIQGAKKYRGDLSTITLQDMNNAMKTGILIPK